MREYFSHDIDALSDIKIDKMMTDYGYQGYGYYWAIVEKMYKNGGRYEFVDLQILAKQLDIKIEKLKCFINACVHKYTHKDKGLFDADDKGFWSNSLIKRIEKKQKCGTRKKDISDCMVFKDKPEVHVHKEMYDMACLKYGKNVVDAGLNELEKWLTSPSPKAKVRKGICHDGYLMRGDTWVIQRGQEIVGEDIGILGRLGRC